MSKHTPGPWHAGRPDMATIVEGFDSKYIYAGDKYVALATDRGIAEWGEVMANARLIAAAPDMLEALDTSALVIHAPHSSLFADCPDVVCAANRAALKKARPE